MFTGGRVIGYLGPPSPHLDALRAVVEPTGGRVVFLPDSPSAGCYRGRLFGRTRRWAAQLRGTRDREFLWETLTTIDQEKVDVVLAYWGTNPLADIRAIREARPNLPCVLMALCHPSGLSASRVRLQNWMMRRAGRYLSGIVYPSERMADYFRANVFGGSAPPGIVVRPCWPGAWHAAEPTQPVSHIPAVVFLGRMDGGQPCDDVREQIHSVTQSGVFVWHVTGGRNLAADRFRRTFRPDSVEAVIRFANGFDAALVWYNTSVCARTDRFAQTIPDRLISAVAAGVPVAIPRRGYGACYEYLADYPAVIPFDTPAELATVLWDRDRVAQLRAAAWAARDSYRAEEEWPQLSSFLDDVTSGVTGRC